MSLHTLVGKGLSYSNEEEVYHAMNHEIVLSYEALIVRLPSY